MESANFIIRKAKALVLFAKSFGSDIPFAFRLLPSALKLQSQPGANVNSAQLSAFVPIRVVEHGVIGRLVFAAGTVAQPLGLGNHDAAGCFYLA
jgi:hypothetical protein